MENVITLQDAANIVTFVAPGYFAIRIYAANYTKRDKEFSRLLVESVVLSFPIAAFTSWLWRLITGSVPLSTDALFALTLLLLASGLGFGFSWLRVQWPMRQIADMLGLGMPDEDFIRTKFALLKSNDSVTITLKNGEIFSGTPGGGSMYTKDGPREYYFTDIAWYDKSKGAWDNRPGGLILNLDQVEYIETP